MTKQAISVTLSPDNLLWLRGRVAASGARSVSEVLDQVIQEARSARAVRSVVGTVTIAESDPLLSRADLVIRTLFAKSLGRGNRSAKDERAEPNYDRTTAEHLVRLGAHVGAMTPGELAEWVATKVR